MGVACWNGVKPKKSRTWSSAIRTITKPRSMSIAVSLEDLLILSLLYWESLEFRPLRGSSRLAP